MNDLIEALKIMMKRGDVKNPTHCVHDELHVYPANFDFTDDELQRLNNLGFLPNDMGGFMSFRFGSC